MFSSPKALEEASPSVIAAACCAGQREVDLKVLRSKTKYYDNLSDDGNCRRVVLLWQVLSEFDQPQLRKFLRFVWGSDYLPADTTDPAWGPGFIVSEGLCTTRLPSAHTCGFQLVLPDYPTAAILR